MPPRTISVSDLDSIRREEGSSITREKREVIVEGLEGIIEQLKVIGDNDQSLILSAIGDIATIDLEPLIKAIDRTASRKVTVAIPDKAPVRYIHTVVRDDRGRAKYVESNPVMDE